MHRSNLLMSSRQHNTQSLFDGNRDVVRHLVDRRFAYVNAAPLLRRHTFGDVSRGLCRAKSQRKDGLIGWRVVPVHCLLGAVKCNDGEDLGRITFDRRDL